MNFDHCKIYTVNLDRDKYQMLIEFSELFDSIMFEILQPEDATPVEELDKETNKVIVFDDIKLDNKNMNNIKEDFSLSRNKKCNFIYLTQSYYDIPKYIRRNRKCFITFAGLDSKDIRHISDDLSKGIGRKELGNIYRQTTLESYSFVTLDKISKYIYHMHIETYSLHFHVVNFPTFIVLSQSQSAYRHFTCEKNDTSNQKRER